MTDVIDFGEDHPPGANEPDECGAETTVTERGRTRPSTHACIDHPGHDGPHTCDCNWTWENHHP